MSKRRRYDSDDEDDEIAAVDNCGGGLGAYATEMGDDMRLELGLDLGTSPGRSASPSSSSSSSTSSATRIPPAAAPLAPLRTSNASAESDRPSGVATPWWRCAPRVDEDIPWPWHDVASSDILALYTSLAHLHHQPQSCAVPKRVDDGLLAQYTAHIQARDASAVSPSQPALLSPPSFPNRFNLRPGWRWDGVVRGNGTESRLLHHP